MAFHNKQQLQQKQQKAHLGGAGTWITQTPATHDHQEGVIINGSGSNGSHSYGSGSGSGSGLTHNLDYSRVKPWPVTLQLFHKTSRTNDPIELDDPHPHPFGWERFLNLQTGAIYYKKPETKSLQSSSSSSSSSSSAIMSQNGTSTPVSPPSLELKLHLSPPRATQHNMNNFPENNYINESSSAMSSPSPTSSCLSSELNYHVGDISISSTGRGGGRRSEESAAETSSTNMVLVGCPNCLMYVMLSSEEQYPKCPKCKSSVLLDFLQAYHGNNKKTRNN